MKTGPRLTLTFLFCSPGGIYDARLVHAQPMEISYCVKLMFFHKHRFGEKTGAAFLNLPFRSIKQWPYGQQVHPAAATTQSKDSEGPPNDRSRKETHLNCFKCARQSVLPAAVSWKSGTPRSAVSAAAAH